MKYFARSKIKLIETGLSFTLFAFVTSPSIGQNQTTRTGIIWVVQAYYGRFTLFCKIVTPPPQKKKKKKLKKIYTYVHVILL